jgi:hypothetical protein
MKIGTLVKHRFDGRDDDVGIVYWVKPNAKMSMGLAKVMWSPGVTLSNDRAYRWKSLEVINEN